MSTRNNGARLFTTAAPDRPTSAVLVFHGGSADSTMKVAPYSLAVLRLVPVAWAISRRNPAAAVYRLRFSVRGWNGDGAGVLGDAQWALDEIRTQHPGLPIVVVGHSLGGRVAMHVAGAAGVVGAVGLAPWVEPTDPVDQVAGVPLAVIQGTNDRMVPEPSTRIWLRRGQQAGAGVESTLIEGAGHAMLRYFWRWHRLTADGVSSVLSSSRQKNVEHPAQPKS